MGISRSLAYGAFFLVALTFSSSSIAAYTSTPRNGTTLVYNGATGVWEAYAYSSLKVPVPLRATVSSASVLSLARRAFSWQTTAAVTAIGIIGSYLADKYSDVHLDDGSLIGTPILQPEIVGDGITPFINAQNGCSIISLGDYVIDSATGYTWTIQPNSPYVPIPSGFIGVNQCPNLPLSADGYMPMLMYSPNTINPYAGQQNQPVEIPISEYEPAISPQLWTDMANSVPDTDSAWSPIADAVQASDTRSDTDGDGWSDADDPWPSMAQYNPDNPNTATNSDGSVTTTYEDGSSSTSHPDGTTTAEPYNPRNSSSPVTSSGTSTTTTTTTNTTTVTNSDNTVTTTTNTETTVVETSISMEWPAFCSWAGIVCSAIDWMRSPPVEPEVPPLPHQEIDVGTLTKDFDSGLGSGSCPSPVSVAFMGQTLTYSYDSACWAASSVFRPILLASAFLIAGFILMGRGDLT